MYLGPGESAKVDLLGPICALIHVIAITQPSLYSDCDLLFVFGEYHRSVNSHIPIVQKSPSDPLPASTDRSMKKMDEEKRKRTNKREKRFVLYWRKEIHRDICEVS